MPASWRAPSHLRGSAARVERLPEPFQSFGSPEWRENGLPDRHARCHAARESSQVGGANCDVSGRFRVRPDSAGRWAGASALRVRLDRFVSQAVGLARSRARSLIRQGGVTVDGLVVTDSARQVGPGHRVVHAGEALALPQPLYLMLHKPVGLLSATRDAHQATVMSLLPPPLAARVHPVGRLDKETSGLLLLTDDGDWSHRITSPRHACPKTYVVELAEPLAADAERRLAAGLLLRSETTPTRPTAVRRLAPRRARVTVTEGRYHMVRRMFAALGNRVVALHRERIGGLSLDQDLAPGDWRTLTAAERDLLPDRGDLDYTE